MIDFRFLRAVQVNFVWKVRFDAACVLEYDLEVDKRGDLGCVPLGCSGSESVIQDHSDHGASKEPMNP